MDDNSIFIEQDDLDFLNMRLNEQYIESKFSFLQEHKGFRNGKIHLLIGTTGSGKSTLARSIMLDCAIDKKVVVWLSEESRRDYALTLNNITRDKRVLDNIVLISELNIPTRAKTDAHEFMFYFKEEVMKHQPDILFIDNVTTSFMYSDVVGFRGQSYTADALRMFADDNFLPIFCIAHTKKNIADNDSKLIDISDVRGSASISNTAAYAYALQVFRNGNLRFPIISIQKSRYHSPENHYFKLIYENGLYTRSVAINMDIVNQIFQLRDRLTDRPGGKGNEK